MGTIWMMARKRGTPFPGTMQEDGLEKNLKNKKCLSGLGGAKVYPVAELRTDVVIKIDEFKRRNLQHKTYTL